MEELRMGFNYMQKKLGLHSNIDCFYFCEEVYQPIDGYNQGCISSLGTISRLTTMWESIVCPHDQFPEWHRRDCLMGDYDLCDVDNMVICPIKEDGSSITLIKWKHFSMGQIITKRREEKKRLQFIFKSIVSSEFIAYLKPKLQFFACHNFLARWQDKMFKSCLENFLVDTLVSIVDFVEKCTFEIQNEVQSMH
jgi:hypothetical protein